MAGVKGRSGGARKGAGRKKGVPNKTTLAREKALREEHKGKDLPREFLLKMMWGEPLEITVDDGNGGTKVEKYYPTIEDRKWAAQHVIPYCNSRLATIEHTGGDGGPIKHEHRLDPAVAEAIDKIASRAAG